MGGWMLFGCCVFTFTLHQLFSTGSSVWLSIWSNKAENLTNESDPEEVLDIEESSSNSTIQNNTSNFHDEEKWFLTVYGLFGVGQTITVVFAVLLLFLST